ncbi:hypothetical protein QR680_007102 [Steinernema hermaphroditum]|uniref:BPTI/Kunitz inhibitor domain-containing protein n=1 Tax=Steinernema hermaphroditum TaxID=289476 RepID=A0AA39LY90_9BILA|nr:hypothetical protein QR680_007102 [Steinernema hermaphroditum]
MKQTLIVLSSIVVLGLACGRFEDATDGVPTQGYYYDEVWDMCFAYKYNKSEAVIYDQFLNHTTRTACEDRCRPMDNGPCFGPYNTTDSGSCSWEEDNCSPGHICMTGAFFRTCCVAENDRMAEEARNETCLNGGKAAGEVHFYDNGNYRFFVPNLGKTCDDLLCGEGKICEQVNKYFARCCEGA